MRGRESRVWPDEEMYVGAGALDEDFAPGAAGEGVLSAMVIAGRMG